MPNQPSVYKQTIAVRITRELYHKVGSLAKMHGVNMSELLVVVLERETRDIELTPEQYEEIAREIRAARAGSNPRKPRATSKNKRTSEDKP